jgi:predicted PurR-regulated permease PerM
LSTVNIILKKNWRLISLITGLILLCVLLWFLRQVLFPFGIALVLAYLMLPILRWAEGKLPQNDRLRNAKHIILVVLFIIFIFSLVGLVIYLMVEIFFATFSSLIANAPRFISSSVLELRKWVEGIRALLPPVLQQQMDEIILQIGYSLASAIQGFFRGGILSLPNIFNPLLSLLSIPVFLFYFLKDSSQLSSSFYSALPQWLAEHIRNLTRIVEMVLGRYIRAQLLLGFVVGYTCFLVLFIMKVPFARTLGLIAGVTELIPILGPWIGGAIAFFVALATVPDKALWVALLFLAIQFFENTFLVPRIHGHYLRIHPAIILVLLVLGAYIAGIWGIILIVPFTSTAIEIYRYFRSNINAGDIDNPRY